MRCEWCSKDKTEDKMVKKRGGFAKHCKSCHKDKYGSPEARRESHLKSRYGLAPGQYDTMLTEQQGACATCGKVKNYKLHVDHCHSTGKVRGLLCAPCNRAIGLLEDSSETLERMVEYLMK